MKSIIMLCLVIFLSSCSSDTKIADLKNHPRDYYEAEVTIEGTVGETFSLLLVKYFALIDSTDSIYVITQKPLPQVGEIIRVKGKIVYYSFLDKEILALKEI